MSRRPSETVITPLKFEICIANAAQQHPNQRITFRTLRPANGAQVHTLVFEMNSEHGASLYALSSFFAGRSSLNLAAVDMYSITTAIVNAPLTQFGKAEAALLCC